MKQRKNLLKTLRDKYPNYTIDDVSHLPTRNFNPSYCSVVTDLGNQHMVITPSGEKLYGTVKTIVTDEVNAQPICEITLFCNLLSDEDAAKYLYNLNQQK